MHHACSAHRNNVCTNSSNIWDNPTLWLKQDALAIEATNDRNRIIENTRFGPHSNKNDFSVVFTHEHFPRCTKRSHSVHLHEGLMAVRSAGRAWRYDEPIVLSTTASAHNFYFCHFWILRIIRSETKKNYYTSACIPLSLHPFLSPY